MDTSASVFYAAGLPTLVSTAITFCYFFLKVCDIIFNAISHKAERRVAMATTSGGQQEHCTDLREEGHMEICKQIPRTFPSTGQYGGKPERPTGSVLLPRRGQNLCLPSIRHDSGDTAEPVVRENEEGLHSRRHRNTEEYYGQGPEDSCDNAAGILKERRSRDHASNEQSQNAQRDG